MIPALIGHTKVPHKPGVYLFKDKSGQVIYVGKAIDLFHRVSSYFTTGSRGVNVIHPPGGLDSHVGIEVKKTLLVEKITSVEFIIVESELEALILEANLIKKYLPVFNVRLTDDKDYLYIRISEEDFPKVITARKHELDHSLKYFGPFPSSRTVRDTLKALRRVFTWCLSPSKRLPHFVRNDAPRPPLARLRPCFYYHIRQCPGACIGVITKEEYRKNINRLIKLLEGKKGQLIKELTKEMESLAKQEKFEEAARVKKTLTGIFYLAQPNRTSSYLENPNFLEDQRQIALGRLKDSLGLKNLPHRIEGYDISNIQGQQSTGSMVVLIEGEIDKSQYRKFKIHLTGKPNDVGMHKEVMKRRLKHSEWPLPDLMIIDGGLGQVRAAELEIRNLFCRRQFEKPLEIPVYGLAKRFEWLYAPDGTVIKLSKSNPALKLLQKLRDEAHRFAITYHRKLHSRVILDPDLIGVDKPE